MRHPLKQFTLIALLAFASGAASGESGVARYNVADLGLQPRAGTATLPAYTAFGSEAAQVWQITRSSDYTLFTGTRAASSLGLRASESFGGIVYSLPGGWGSSFEAAYAQESMLATRRYSLSGQLHTSLSEGRALSVGLKYGYGAQDTDAGLRNGATGDTQLNNSYSLAPLFQSGAGFAQSYQLQMNYQHSIASSFGLALGREVETFAPFQDPPSSSLRQLTFTGQHLLTPSWALSYDLLYQDAATPLRVQGLRLGMRYRF